MPSDVLLEDDDFAGGVECSVEPEGADDIAAPADDATVAQTDLERVHRLASVARLFPPAARLRFVIHATDTPPIE